MSTVAVVGLGSTSAFATTPAAKPQGLATIKAKAAAAITLRVNELNSAISKVNAAAQLGSSGASLVRYLQADVSPLQALGTKIAGDTTTSTALADYSTIFTSYRILALVLPSAHVGARADEIDATAIPGLTTISTKAASHVNSSNAATLQPLIDDLNTQIQAATNRTANVASTVLGYTPRSGMPTATCWRRHTDRCRRRRATLRRRGATSSRSAPSCTHALLG